MSPDPLLSRLRNNTPTARTGPFLGPLQAFSAVFACTGPSAGPVQALQAAVQVAAQAGVPVTLPRFGTAHLVSICKSGNYKTSGAEPLF